MLHPKQFEVNEAWIMFRLNSAPIQTERDGDFNCVALMDAASCFILGSELVAVDAHDLPQLQARRLLKLGSRNSKNPPKRLFIAKDLAAGSFSQQAARLGISVELVPLSQLRAFVAEARTGFKQFHQASSS